jgi:putative DNA primase/helicase
MFGALACKPLAAASLTPAVLYRVVEAFAPTILVDEADTFLADQDELRGILNAGHDRHSAVVPRCVGDDFEPKVFRVFGAVAIAAMESFRTR